MNVEELKTMTAAVRGGEPVCRPARLLPIFQQDKTRTAFCQFPADDAVALRRAFCAAPQFAMIDADAVLRRARRQGLRVILLSESAYYARQAALYLAAIAAAERREAGTEEYDLGMDDQLNELLNEAKQELRRSLFVYDASVLDPQINESVDANGPTAALEAGRKRIDICAVPSPAFLVWSGSGAVLSDTVAGQLEIAGHAGKDIFVALTNAQIDRELIEELRLKQHFTVVRVTQPSERYLGSVLRAAVVEQRAALSANVDLLAAVAHMRRLRGRRFEETDLYDAAARAAEEAESGVLTTENLMYRPYSGTGERSAMDRLNAMIGLESVKAALRRQLAVAALNARRGRASFGSRNLAFSGSPGTGKSVTARLVAEILREEGCGTGRFVEAGREQLVGKYVGHTSPKIAKLFERSRGGVLFIDEAGALIPRHGDSYAEEAVNALVRHMELEMETMVIFATYPREMKELLDTNPGLSSRIAQVLEFEDYTDDQLWEILGTLAEKDGFTLPADAYDICCGFFHTLRGRRGVNFGNGREARRLRDAAVEELALRAMEDPQARKLTAADFSAAAVRLLAQENGETAGRVIGFGGGDAT